jgi:hypothetical protein
VTRRGLNFRFYGGFFFHYDCAAMGEMLGALAKLRKATITFLSVCPSGWNNSASTGRILMKLDI